MNNINSYVNDLMRNKVNYKNDSLSSISTDTEFIANMVGGGEDKHIPTGGFPPIYECNNVDSKEDLNIYDNEKNKKRKYKSHKSTVSISDIIKENKEITPFF